MPKIAFIGAGSAKFVRASIADILKNPALADARVTLMDIDAARLAKTETLVNLMVRGKQSRIQVEATTDQRRALDGADFVFVTVMVGGMKHYRTDTFVPERHGLSIAVGDSSGPGAVFRLVRTAPVLRDIARNLKELAPHALVINYANPMAMLTRAYIESGHANVVGLCHSIPGAVAQIAGWLDIPKEEIDYLAAGINHLAGFLKLAHRGRDLLPALMEKSDWIIRNATNWEADTWRHEARGYERIRMDLLRMFGFFPAEGPWHQGDFYGWFRKTPELALKYGPAPGWAYNFDLKLLEAAQKSIDDMIAGRSPVEYPESNDAGAHIIGAMVTGKNFSFYGNVANRGLISNLPPDEVVEVPCTAGSRGIEPQTVGALPPQFAALMHPHSESHELAIRGVLAKDRALIRQAIAVDPLTQAAHTPQQIEAMVNELFECNAPFMRDWPPL